jgi:hypothetical protein
VDPATRPEAVVLACSVAVAAAPALSIQRPRRARQRVVGVTPEVALQLEPSQDGVA